MKHAWRLNIIGLLLLLSQVASAAQPAATPADLMARANQAYEAGQFAAAAELYQALVDAGIEDGVLFYNLGNAYFKQEDWGRAILNYRRAQRLMPRDPDIRANLTLARIQTVDQIDTQGDLLSRITRLAQQWLTLNEMAITTLALWFALVMLVILFMRLSYERIRQWLTYLIIVVVILLVGGFFSLGGRLYVEHVRPGGVIIAEQVEVMSGPGEQYILEFTLHNGTEVSILEERPRWVRLSLPGGQLQGWVPAPAVAAIVRYLFR